MLLLLLCAALLAGWVDAIVGGGSLIQLPALLLVPGLTPAQALGANKVSSVMGTAVAAATYRRRLGLAEGALATAGAALVAATCGARAATWLPTEAFTPIVVVALTAVLAITVLRPSAFTGTTGRQRPVERAVRTRSLVIGLLAGFYDGLLGPGTGSFLLLGLILLTGLAALPATAMAKVVNLASNVGALVLFSLAGVVQWRLGLCMGAANMLGGWLGARTATRLGPRFVRIVLIVVVLGLLARLTLQ